MVLHQHDFSYAVSIHQTVRISYHTVGTWKVLHNEFFHVPSNHEEVGISWHTLNSYMVVQQDYAFCIGERGNGCCCSFKNVTQPLMFICQTWIEKCQESLDFKHEIIRFYEKSQKNPKKLRNFPKIAYFFQKKLSLITSFSYNQVLLYEKIWLQRFCLL